MSEVGSSVMRWSSGAGYFTFFPGVGCMPEDRCNSETGSWVCLGILRKENTRFVGINVKLRAVGNAKSAWTLVRLEVKCVWGAWLHSVRCKSPPWPECGVSISGPILRHSFRLRLGVKLSRNQPWGFRAPVNGCLHAAVAAARSTPFGNWYNIWLYGSNSATDFNDVSNINVSGNMILLYTFTYSGSWSRAWVIPY